MLTPALCADDDDFWGQDDDSASGSYGSDDDDDDDTYYGDMSSYTITASCGSDTQELYMNLPDVGVVDEGAYSYFEIPAANVLESGLTVALATNNQDEGDADLYMACSSDPLPTQSSYTRSSINSGDTPDVIVYKSTDSDACTEEESYIVGVYGYGASTFSVVASPEDRHLSWISTPLGVRLAGELTEGIPDYYLYHLGNETSVQVTVTAPAGDSVLDMAVRALHNSSDERTLPTMDNADFKTAAKLGGSASLTIDASAPVMQSAWGIAIGVLTDSHKNDPDYYIEVSLVSGKHSYHSEQVVNKFAVKAQAKTERKSFKAKRHMAKLAKADAASKQRKRSFGKTQPKQ